MLTIVLKLPKTKVSDMLDYNTVDNASEEMIFHQPKRMIKNAT